MIFISFCKHALGFTEQGKRMDLGQGFRDHVIDNCYHCNCLYLVLFEGNVFSMYYKNTTGAKIIP